MAARRHGWSRAHPAALALGRRLSRRSVKRARIKSVVLLSLLAGVLAVYHFRGDLAGGDADTAVRWIVAAAVVALGWELGRDFERALAPPLFNRLEPGTAGTMDFLLRLLTMLAAVVVALRIAGITPRTLALGGAVTAVIVGLAAQQTIGHLIAGTVLLTAHPFRVGERVRLQGGPLAGSLEGTVSTLGLLYTTFSSGGDPILVPNAVLLNVAITPLREPTGVDLRARLRAGISPTDVEQHLREHISTPLRGAPRITLEELDGDEVVVRIAATPRNPADGPRLASEVVRAVAPFVRAGGEA
jgi:small conductance mechanosensitive channel